MQDLPLELLEIAIDVFRLIPRGPVAPADAIETAFKE